MENILIQIAESFNQWLEKVAEESGMSKDDVQEIIREFLK